MENMAVNFWKNRNVFVTGATGLLGSWLVEDLWRKGANVTCLVRDSVPAGKAASSGVLDAVNVVRGELEDYPMLP